MGGGEERLEGEKAQCIVEYIHTAEPAETRRVKQARSLQAAPKPWPLAWFLELPLEEEPPKNFTQARFIKVHEDRGID